MKELNFDSGLVTYSLNGKCEVSFNPTDSNFVERLYSAFEELDKKDIRHKSRRWLINGRFSTSPESGTQRCAASSMAYSMRP